MAFQRLFNALSSISLGKNKRSQALVNFYVFLTLKFGCRVNRHFKLVLKRLNTILTFFISRVFLMFTFISLPKYPQTPPTNLFNMFFLKAGWDCTLYSWLFPSPKTLVKSPAKNLVNKFAKKLQQTKKSVRPSRPAIAWVVLFGCFVFRVLLWETKANNKATYKKKHVFT